jgi:hypothetical protein
MVEFKPNQGGLNVANELTELTPHITAMRTKLSQTAEHERLLTQALSDELKRMDQQTLQSVRSLSAEHEARRAGILLELQALAASMGTFLPARDPVESVTISQDGRPHATAVGDWRQATKNLSYHDELEFLLRNGRLDDNSSPH